MKSPNWRVAAAITTTSLLAASLAACGSSGSGSTSATGAAKGKITIGFSPATLAAPDLKALAEGVAGYAKSKGIATLTADPKADPSTQVQQLLGWINRGQVQAVWILPVSAGALRQVLTAAQSKGVVVLAAGTAKDYGYDGPTSGISFSNVDNVAYGTAVGSALSACINAKLGGTGKVIFIREPVTNSSGNTILMNSAKAALAAGSPQAKIVAEVNGNDDRLTSQQATASALQAHQDANALIGFVDASTLGGLASLKKTGRSSSALCVAGAGGGAEGKQAVTDGSMYADIAFDYATDLRQNVDLLAAMAAHPKATGKQLTVPVITNKATP